MTPIPWWIARAGGRRRYNKQRQLAAAERRRVVVDLLASGRSQSSIAVLMGVDRATICRDARWLGKLPELVRDMPGSTVRITPRGWKHSYSYSAWRGLLPGRAFNALRVRLTPTANSG
jgi:hypothetical protein